MTPLTIEVNSKEDFAKGKRLFEGWSEETKDNPIHMGKLEAVGILEGGCTSGGTSVMLLCRIKLNDEQSLLVAAETTAALFLNAGVVVHQAVRRFEPNAKNEGKI